MIDNMSCDLLRSTKVGLPSIVTFQAYISIASPIVKIIQFIPYKTHTRPTLKETGRAERKTERRARKKREQGKGGMHANRWRNRHRCCYFISFLLTCVKLPW
ncbi:unnamed protein product [Trifolium pratense]|uniref:Uncharacterized protein n=1 Tax=Trifolium pratense TaxID=57577 RepID=A0ACB0LM27_TRIPR|nr:unnamed protein product [Trifolium pratense]